VESMSPTGPAPTTTEKLGQYRAAHVVEWEGNPPMS
jgi:hypothetical protein